MTDTPDEAARIAVAIRGYFASADSEREFADACMKTTRDLRTYAATCARAAAEEMRRRAAAVLTNGHFLSEDSHEAKWAEQVAALILALPLPDAPAMPARAPERWYVGAQNDGLFIINKPPRPSNDDQWHDRPDGPTVVLPVEPLTPERVQVIVDAHNSSLMPARAPDGWRPISEAPKNSKDVLLWGSRWAMSVQGRWLIPSAAALKGYWQQMGGGEVFPTHFMPLPAPPQPEPGKSP